MRAGPIRKCTKVVDARVDRPFERAEAGFVCVSRIDHEHFGVIEQIVEPSRVDIDADPAGRVDLIVAHTYNFALQPDFHAVKRGLGGPGPLFFQVFEARLAPEKTEYRIDARLRACDRAVDAFRGQKQGTDHAARRADFAQRCTKALEIRKARKLVQGGDHDLGARGVHRAPRVSGLSRASTVGRERGEPAGAGPPPIDREPRRKRQTSMVWEDYVVGDSYDEMFESPGRPRAGCERLADRLAALYPDELTRRQNAAEVAMLNLGVTFNVYGDDAGTEKIFPFDVVPRVIPADTWATLEQGLIQRIQALNLFVDDLYSEQRILKDGVIPRDIIEGSPGFLPSCQGLKPPRGIWIHITGTDLVRDRDGAFYVLEDNLRCPSGVSYVLENRAIMKRTFPSVFERAGVRPVDQYPSDLLMTLQAMSPNPTATVAVLTPGIYNAAYFEHSLLARQMGVEVVEGRDLVVDDGFIKARTTRGLERVDVLYRRIDDTFLDPQVFRPESVLGVKGLIDVYRSGRVALANAPGTGVADDKAVYAFTPEVVKYYLQQDPILPIVPTYLCRRDEDRAYVLDHLDELVVKATNESGGYGMLIGPRATTEARAEFADRILEHPEGYIAQPTLSLSTVPTLVDGQLEGRHVDLRPYILYGDEVRVTPGGLTRVALKRGSLVVNSSQGGGSKDTWVLTGAGNGGETC